MDRNKIVWVLECCLLYIDGTTKKQMIEYGSPEELAEMGIKLYEVLKEKELHTLHA